MIMVKNSLVLALLGAVAWAFGVSSVSAMSHGGALPRVPQLTIEVAEAAAVACANYAKLQEGWRTVNVAVLDKAGDLLYFRREPSSFRGSIDIAINKAWTATRFGFPTRALGENIVNREPGKVHGIQFMDRLIIFPGGLPIVVDGVLIGGIGVSGATGDQDEECAQAGLDAIAGKLK